MPELLALRRKIGVLFQDGALFGSMSVFDNVAFPLRQHTDYTEGAIAKRVRERLSRRRARGRDGRAPSQLSGGMRKRAGFARALVMEPDIVIFDEPDSGLDPVRTALLCELIQEMHTDPQRHLHRRHPQHRLGAADRRIHRAAVARADRRGRRRREDVLLGEPVRAPVPERLGRGAADDGLRRSTGEARRARCAPGA